MAKLIGTRAAIAAVEQAVALVGNDGLTRKYPLERHYRDVLCSRVHTRRTTRSWPRQGSPLSQRRPRIFHNARPAVAVRAFAVSSWWAAAAAEGLRATRSATSVWAQAVLVGAGRGSHQGQVDDVALCVTAAYGIGPRPDVDHQVDRPAGTAGGERAEP